jgi:hypothetical protein
VQRSEHPVPVTGADDRGGAAGEQVRLSSLDARQDPQVRKPRSAVLDTGQVPGYVQYLDPAPPARVRGDPGDRVDYLRAAQSLLSHAENFGGDSASVVDLRLDWRGQVTRPYHSASRGRALVIT